MSSVNLARRGFLQVSAAIGGGLLVGFRWPEKGADAPLAGDFAPNAFVRIAPDGRVTVIINKAEMGQGPSTSLCQLLADELDADWSKVGFEFAPVDPVYAHPGFGIQMTGGSTSTFAMSLPMRKAGAAARALLVQAAGEKWKVPATTRRSSAQPTASSRTRRRSSRRPPTCRSRTRRTSS